MVTHFIVRSVCYSALCYPSVGAFFLSLLFFTFYVGGLLVHFARRFVSILMDMLLSTKEKKSKGRRRKKWIYVALGANLGNKFTKFVFKKMDSTSAFFQK